jgi:hypothetical protein
MDEFGGSMTCRTGLENRTGLNEFGATRRNVAHRQWLNEAGQPLAAVAPNSRVTDAMMEGQMSYTIAFLPRPPCFETPKIANCR